MIITPGTYSYVAWPGAPAVLVQVHDDGGELVARFEDPDEGAADIPLADMAGRFSAGVSVSPG